MDKQTIQYINKQLDKYDQSLKEMTDIINKLENRIFNFSREVSRLANHSIKI